MANVPDRIDAAAPAAACAAARPGARPESRHGSRPESRAVSRPESRPVSRAVCCALRFIDTHFAQPLNLHMLADVAGLSVSRFAARFRDEVGLSPHRYLCRVRIRRAQDLLLRGVPPSVVATEVGFFDQSHLGRHFRRAVGLTPCDYVARPVALLDEPNLDAPDDAPARMSRARAASRPPGRGAECCGVRSSACGDA
ncbi:helix-turn-helix domain protein [Burkholderia sp. ABCPW 111]|nr:helix-turn-helix domain protein [Burkholderia sp. ABCPW 111]